MGAYQWCAYADLQSLVPPGRHTGSRAVALVFMILVNTTSSSPPGGRAVLYARVCDQDQRADLDRHVARLTEWAAV